MTTHCSLKATRGSLLQRASTIHRFRTCHFAPRSDRGIGAVTACARARPRTRATACRVRRVLGMLRPGVVVVLLSTLGACGNGGSAASPTTSSSIRTTTSSGTTGSSQSGSSGVQSSASCSTYSCNIPYAGICPYGVETPLDAQGCPTACRCAVFEGDGGTAADGGAGPCGPGITFELDAPVGAATPHCATVFGATTGIAPWLSLETPDAGAASFVPPSRSVVCGSCVVGAPSPVDLTQALGPGLPPVTYVWDGTTPQFSTCTAGGDVFVCAAPTCMPAGSYVAHMCARSDCSSGDDASAAETCVDVPFDYPSSSPTVVGALP
jgi:hypothetical protein